MNRLRDVNREQLQTKVSKTGLRFRNECGPAFLASKLLRTELTVTWKLKNVCFFLQDDNCKENAAML
jgi:hypothetical protein